MATLMLVHGAFHSPSCWRKIVPLLEQACVPCFLLDRAFPLTSTRRAAVSRDPAWEAQQINDAIADHIKGPVVLVGHSKGGDAVTFGGNHEQVVHLVYFAAHVPGIDVPESMVVTNPKLKEGFIKNDDRTWDLDPVIAKQLLYSDCDFDKGDGIGVLSELLRPQAMPSKEVCNLPFAYQSEIATYIICSEDQTTFPDAQQSWASQLEKNHDCDIVELSTGRSPFWSNPKLLADALIAIASSFDRLQ